jgi:histidine ammonia-lyase
MPQVFGAVEAALDHGRNVLGAAINGVSDNPLIFGNDILSGGNFHAEPLAMLSDYLNMFLTKEPGLE